MGSQRAQETLVFSNTFYFGYPDGTSGKDGFLVACLEKTSSSSPKKVGFI